MQHNSDFFSKKESFVIANRSKRWTRYKALVFLICVATSFVLWYFSSYSKKEMVGFSLSVQAGECLPKYVLTEQSEKEITFQAQSFLYDLDKIKKRDRLTVDMSNIRVEKIKGRYQGVLPVEPFLQNFFRQIDYNGYFESLSPDTIVFFFEISEKKEVCVVLDVQYDIADQYRQYVPTAISPQTVLIEGRKEMVDTIGSIKTSPLNIGVIKDTFNQMIALEKHPLLCSSHDSVHVFIPVTEFTEKQLKVAVNVGALDGSLFIKLLPEHVTISCLVPVEKFNDLTSDMFTLEVHYIPEMAKYEKKLPVKIIVFPENVQITRIQPEYVDYIIIEQ